LATAPPLTALGRFAIGFDHRDRERLHALWDQALDSERWSEGTLVLGFERAWEAWNGVPAVAYSSWSGAASAALTYAGVRGETVLCPSNTFMATPFAALQAGARVEFVDCNRGDLCVSFEDFERKALAHRPRAAFLVHIGGHIAFDVEEIAAFCAAEGIFLIEDCAHAHGAEWQGRRAGMWGDAGIWSFAATKTISTGEGGMLVSRQPELVEFARAFRNYGKPDHAVRGFNHRMNEFTAALGIVNTERLDEIVSAKNADARELLAHLHERQVPFAVATSGARHTAGSALALLGLPDDVPVVTRDLVERAKPDPHLFLAAARRLGVDPAHCFVVGDSVWDLLAAQRAGALGIGLLSGGYGREELERSGTRNGVFLDRQYSHRLLDEFERGGFVIKKRIG